MHILDKRKDFNQWSVIWSTSTSILFPLFHYIVLNIIDISVSAIFVHIIICVLFVGREQSINCDNFLSEPIAVLFAIRLY